MHKIEGNKIIFDNDGIFKLLSPIEFGGHSNIYKLKIDGIIYAVKKYNWNYNEDEKSIENKISINIDSYITPQKLLYIGNKFEGYIMKFCKGKDLEKRRLNISVSEFAESTVKLMEDTDKLSKLKYNIFDSFITNVMYDDGFKMIDTDDYPYVQELSLNIIKQENTKRLNQMLCEIFIKNAGLANLYFGNVEFKKMMKKCEDGDILFEELFNSLCTRAYNIADRELENINEVGKVLLKSKKI